MKKRVMMVLLCGVLAASTLAGCGSKNNDNKKDEKESVKDEDKDDKDDKEDNKDNKVDDPEPVVANPEYLFSGIYYDPYTYEETGEYLCVILRENGDAYIGMRDDAFGEWDPTTGIISIPDWNVDWSCECIGESLFFYDDDFEYVRSTDDVTPQWAYDYYSTGNLYLGVITPFEATLSGSYEEWQLDDQYNLLLDYDYGVAVQAPYYMVFDNSSTYGVVAYNGLDGFYQGRNVSDDIIANWNNFVTYSEYVYDFVSMDIFEQIKALYKEDGEWVYDVELDSSYYGDAALGGWEFEIVTDSYDIMVDAVLYYDEGSGEYVIGVEYYSYGDVTTEVELDNCYVTGI